MPATQPAHQAWEDVHWAEPTSRKNVNGLLVKLPRDGLRRENSKEGAQGLLSRLAHARLLWWLLAKAGRQRERQTLLASAREDEQGHLTARLESATGPVNESQNNKPQGSLCLLYNADAAASCLWVWCSSSKPRLYTQTARVQVLTSSFTDWVILGQTVP